MTTKKTEIPDVDLIPPHDVEPDPYVEDDNYDKANDDVDPNEQGHPDETPNLVTEQVQVDLFTGPMMLALAAGPRTATLALSGPHIQARSYTRGRNLVERPAVNLLVVHSAEGATDEVGLGSFFSRATSGSATCGIGLDGGYATYVNYADTCWAAPPMNQEAEHVELCGFAKWTRDQWLAHTRMLETLARWIAWRCAVRRIPIVLLSEADLKAGKAGIVDHDSISKVYKKSDHWDVGENFPWDVVIPRAKQIAGVGGTTPPAAKYHVVAKGETLSAIARKYKTTVKALQAANGLKDADVLAIGQRLKIVVAPASTDPAKPAAPTKGMRGRFPYPSDHYFYTPTADRRCHSGFYDVDKPYVRMIQEEVGATVDGDYGPNTLKAVMAWQGKRNLQKDGVIGPISWARGAAS